MRAHWFQHVPFEGLGSIEPWLQAAGFEITKTPFFASAALPDPAAVDFLVVMGGPMSVNDEAELPWLAQEKQFIRRIIDSGKPVLGVCLGAQLIASALGSTVRRNPVKEIGWFPIRGVSSAGHSKPDHSHGGPSPLPSPRLRGEGMAPSPSPRGGEGRGEGNRERALFQFPESIEVFHWHGETFDLPAGATLLASSEGCPNQAFQIGCTVIGLQFHLETTPETAREIVTHCRAELEPSRFVQRESAILSAPPEKYRAINNLMSNVLSFLTTADQSSR